jgi:hypothetical protein
MVGTHMIKHLYKTLIISILCGSLLSFQSTVVFAAGTNTTDRNGVITNTQSLKFNKLEDSDMLASLMMLGGGFITGRMIQSYRPITMDVTIAGAAGAAFIAGEIMSNLKFKGEIDEMTIEVQKKSDGTVNEEQIQRLQDLKKSYEEAKSTTEIKKMLQLASAAGFGLAAAAAIYLSMTEDKQILSCKAAMTATSNSLAGCIASGSTGNAEAAACGVCKTAFDTFTTNLNTYQATRGIPKPSFFQDKSTKPIEDLTLASSKTCIASGPVTGPASRTLSSVCGAAVLQMIADQTDANLKNLTPRAHMNAFLNSTVIASEYHEHMSIQENYMEKILSIFFPKAEAGWLPLLGLSAGVAAAFIPMTAATASEIDLLMYVPRNRAIAFGLFAATAYMATQASDNVIAKLDENIKKINGILNDLSKMAAGVKAQNLKQQQISIKTINSENQTLLPFSTNDSFKTECLDSNSTTNCKSISGILKSMPGFANLPDSFKDLASQTTTLGDNLSGVSGITGSALSGAEAIASKQNAVSKFVKIKQEEEKFSEKMKAGIKMALQKSGMTASSMMASIGSTPINSTKQKADNTSLTTKTPATGNAIDIGGGSGSADKDKSLDLNFKDTSSENFATVDSSGGTSGANAPQYEIDSNEINGQNGPSLFEVISSRYIKSGYPKLLEEEPVKN